MLSADIHSRSPQQRRFQVVIASAAKQSRPFYTRSGRDCFVASLL